MRNLPLLIKHLALIMLVVHLTTVTSNYGFKKELVEPLQDLASMTVYLEADNSGHALLKLFKPPKQSFIDYEALFSNPVLLPAYLPCVSEIIQYDDFRPPPEVYPEIFVPPQNFA